MSAASAEVEQMMAMGFDQAQSTLALRKHANNVAAAVEWLFSKAGRDEASVQPQIAFAPPAHAARAAAAAPAGPAPLAQARVRQPNANGHAAAAAGPRIIQRGPSASAASSSSAPSPQSLFALQASLPAGHSLGQVKKFFDQPDRLYGFVEVLGGGFFPDAFFKWDWVWSFGQPAVKAAAAPHEPFVTSGDIIAFKMVEQPHFRTAAGESKKFMALDVRVLQYSTKFPPAKRRSQAQVAEGANAPHLHGAASGAVRPARFGCAAGAGSGAVAAAAPHPQHSQSVSQQPLEELVGTRMRGVVTRLSTSSDASASGGGGGRAVGPHGFLALHHCSNCTVLFFGTELREVRHLAASNPSAPVGAVAAQKMRALHPGDVLELTLRRDPVAAWAAEDLALVPTLSYGQMAEQRRRELAQLEAEESVLPQIRALARKLPLLYISGSSVSEDESRHLEFKSLTRSASVLGMGNNLVKTAEKYINSFLNSGGGVLLFGVENDGQVAGLPLSKIDRDQLRTTIDGLMTAGTPPVDPRLYSLRFVPVLRLYKSAWAEMVDVGEGMQSLGALQAQGNSPQDMVELMHSPAVEDRVESCTPPTFVVAIVVAAGETHVPFYQTSGRGFEGRECYVRSEGSSIKMTPVMIAERTRSLQVQRQGASAKDDASSVQDAKIAELMGMLRAMEKRMAQSEAEKAAAIAGAGAGAGASAAASSASPSSSSAAASAAPGEPDETSGSSGGSGARGELEIPAQLLKVLIGMDFSSGDVLEAIESLHQREALDFKAAFRAGASARAQESAVNAVIEQLINKAASGPAPAASASASASASSAVAASLSHSGGEEHPPAASGAQGLSAAHLEELRRIERDSEALSLQPEQEQRHRDAEGSPFAEAGSFSYPGGGGGGGGGADSAEGSEELEQEKLSLPCEVCGNLVAWKDLEGHQRACLDREAEINDGLAAAAERQINLRPDEQVGEEEQD